MSDFTIVVAPTSTVQRTIAGWMEEGLARHGLRTIIEPFRSKVRTKRVACWGWRKGLALRQSGHDVLVMERAYLGDRFHYTALGWNGLNGRADFRNENVPSDRWERLFRPLMQPWKDGGEYVLLMGQVRGDMSLAGQDLGIWYAETAAKCAKAYGLPVMFRPHPVSVKRNDAKCPRGASLINGTLEDALAGAAVVVTYNSNSATDAVMAGVPTVTCDPGAMAWAVTGHSIGEIAKPDREDWGRRLAYCQWSPEEIQSGEAWAHIGAGR